MLSASVEVVAVLDILNNIFQEILETIIEKNILMFVKMVRTTLFRAIAMGGNCITTRERKIRLNSDYGKGN